MKNFILTLVLICGALISNAQIIHVNNQSTINSHYVSLQDAINEASEGDSILVHPSNVSYGEISITKRVVLIAKSLLKSTHKETAKIDKIILENISDDNSDASHSVIQGFEINYLMTISDPGNYVQNVTLMSNKLNFKPKTHSTKTWKIANNRMRN